MIVMYKANMATMANPTNIHMGKETEDLNVLICSAKSGFIALLGVSFSQVPQCTIAFFR